MRFVDTAHAQRVLAERLDVRVEPGLEPLGVGLTLERAVVELGAGAFANVHTLEWDTAKVRARLLSRDPPRSALQVAAALPSALAVATGSFFFLADRARSRPKSLHLNLCVERGVLLSAPTRDQEVLLRRRGAPSRVETLRARGTLELDGRALEWEGAGTGRAAPVTLYGSGCAVITHTNVPGLGRARVLDPLTTRTPDTHTPGVCDVGLRRVGEAFEVVDARERGGVELFAHDLVARVPAELARPGARLRVRDVDGMGLGEELEDGVSVGPSVLYEGIEDHPTDRDRSLGSTPLLTRRRASRMVFSRHGELARLTLFDARPGSETFVGVTLSEASAWVRARGVSSGCFLDSGNTPKFAIARGAGHECVGNRHYLRWPTGDDPTYLWTPDHGRPTASLLALCRI